MARHRGAHHAHDQRSLLIAGTLFAAAAVLPSVTGHKPLTAGPVNLPTSSDVSYPHTETVGYTTGR